MKTQTKPTPAFHWHSSIGTFRVVLWRDGWRLHLDDEHLGTHESPQVAVDQVAPVHFRSPRSSVALPPRSIPVDVSDWLPEMA